MKGYVRLHGIDGQDQASLPRLVLLALFFFAGAFLGQVLAGKVPENTGTELEQYLADFVRLGATEPGGDTVLSAAVIYLRYPMAAFLLGFVSAGIVLIPMLSAAFGFFLSFSVCCFMTAFGKEGVLLALAVFGLRCLVTMPCFFLLAAPAWGLSAARLPVGRGRRAAAPAYGREGWLRAGVVCGVLLCGICAELFLSPQLLELVAQRVLN